MASFQSDISVSIIAMNLLPGCCWQNLVIFPNHCTYLETLLPLHCDDIHLSFWVDFTCICEFIRCAIISIIDGTTRLCSTYCYDYLSDMIWSWYNIFMGLNYSELQLICVALTMTKGVEGVIPTCFLLLVPFLESAMYAPPFSTASQSQYLGNFLMQWWVYV